MSCIQESADNLDRDLLTPGRYPLIGGGSFQGFKFLPNIGDIMAGVALRTIKPDSLRSDLCKEWAGTELEKRYHYIAAWFQS